MEESHSQKKNSVNAVLLTYQLSKSKGQKVPKQDEQLLYCYYKRYNLKYIQRAMKITAVCVYKQVKTFNSQIGSQTIYILLHSLSSVSAFPYLAELSQKFLYVKSLSDVLTANIHFKYVLKCHLIWETFPNPPINCTLLDFSSLPLL